MGCDTIWKRDIHQSKMCTADHVTMINETASIGFLLHRSENVSNFGKSSQNEGLEQFLKFTAQF